MTDTVRAAEQPDVEAIRANAVHTQPLAWVGAQDPATPHTDDCRGCKIDAALDRLVAALAGETAARQKAEGKLWARDEQLAAAFRTAGRAKVNLAAARRALAQIETVRTLEGAQRLAHAALASLPGEPPPPSEQREPRTAAGAPTE